MKWPLCIFLVFLMCFLRLMDAVLSSPYLRFRMVSLVSRYMKLINTANMLSYTISRREKRKIVCVKLNLSLFLDSSGKKASLSRLNYSSLSYLSLIKRNMR